jgi:hypothetical protein
MFELLLLVAVGFFLAGRFSTRRRVASEYAQRIQTLSRENTRLARMLFRE